MQTIDVLFGFDLPEFGKGIEKGVNDPKEVDEAPNEETEKKESEEKPSKDELRND